MGKSAEGHGTGSSMAHKQKVLLVHNFYQIPGGEDSVVANERKLLEENGHDVVFYSRDNSEIGRMGKIRKLALPIMTIFNPKTYREIKSIIRKQGVEIVHVHNTLNLISPAVYYAARACGVPVVQTLHNFRLLCPNGIFYRDGHICEDCLEKGLGCAVKHGCYRGSRAQTLVCVTGAKLHRLTGIYGKINYICMTDFNKDKLMNMKGLREDNVFIKPNFMKRRREPLSPGQRRDQLIFAGRLDKLKGVDVMLQAWKLMGANAPRLILCGTGPMEDWCRRFIADNGLNVEMRGFVPNDEVLSLIAESRAALLPTQLYETFPMSIVEAFSVGTPLLCSDIGNAGNLVQEGVTGCKFAPNSSEDIARAVKRLLADATLCEKAFRVYEDNYTAEKNYQLLMEIYGGLQA